MKPKSIISSLLVKLIFVVAISLSFTNSSVASHAMGADFTYKCLGGNQYELKLKFYRDCQGVSAPTTVPIVLNSVICALNFNYSLPMVSFQEISSTCPSALSTCQSGTEPGVEEYIYMDTVSIANQCSDWIFSFTHCCRNNSINNLVNSSGENLYIQSGMNNSGGICNASPVFSSLGVPYLCNNVQTNFNFGAFDVDGDSLVFSLANPLTTGGVPITHQIPYSVTYPIITTTGTVDFDTTNGQMSFTPSGLQVCVVTVLVEEYRAGILIGSVMRDIQILITNCAGNVPPTMKSGGIINVMNGTLIDTARVELCIGDALSFDLTFGDDNAADTVTLETNIAADFPTATFVTTGVNPVVATFSWTPTASDVGLNNLTVSVSDGVCPIMGTQNYAFEINVLAGTYAGPDVYLCLTDTTQMQGEGGASFQWTPSTGLANDTLANTLAYPTVTTTYMLTSNFSGSCDTVDSMTIFVVPNFTPSFSSDVTVCQGGSTQLSADGSPSQAYSYQWTPSAGLDSTQVAMPVASPTLTTTYTVTITSPALCSKSGSITVTVDSTTLNVTPTASNKYLCPGDSTVLDANINASNPSYTITWQDQDSIIVATTETVTVSPTTNMTYTVIITNGTCTDVKSIDIIMSMLEIGMDSVALCAGDSLITNPTYGPIGSSPPTACGISAGCNGTGGVNTITVGAGTISNGTNTYPAPFGNWFKNAKHQILYSAADLLAAGLTAGTITEIGFSIDSIAGTSLYKSYEIKLSCTPITAISKWESGLTQVFAPTDVTIVPGMNTLVLSSPYDWDGVTNLIMELCYDNLSDPSFTLNSPSPYTTTSYPSVIYYIDDLNAACPFTAGSSGTSSDRPNTTFTVCSEAFAPMFSWTPSAGVSDDTIVNPTITPSASATYSLTMDNGLCVITDSIYVAYSSSLGLTGSTVDASCGNTDGTATVSVGGGSAPFTYLWDDPGSQTNATATGLGVGSYAVNITDGNGCVDSVIVSVSEAGGPTLTSSQVDLICFGGSTGTATVTATGGTSPYTYLWDDPGAQTTATANGLTAGSYTVNVTGGGCASAIAVTLTQPAQMGSTTTNTSPTCFGDCDGGAAVVVTGGLSPYNYLWDDPSAQTNAAASGLCDGTFNVIFTDADGCSDSTNVTVTEPVAIITSITGMTHNPCFGDCVGTATIGVGSGGVAPFNYLWDDPAAQISTTATGLCAGSYVGTVTDADGCTSNAVAVITEPTGTALVMSSIDAGCGASDGAAIVTVSGGVLPYTYTWNDPGTQTTDTASNVGFGVYTVVVTDSNGCSRTDSVAVNNIGAPTLTAVVDSNASCFGSSDGVATASAAGGTPPFQYTWNDPGTQTTATANGLAAGNYTVTVADSALCAATAFVTITEPTQLMGNIAVTDVFCNAACDGTGMVTASGGTPPYNYVWNDPAAQTNASATGLCAGLRLCIITDSNGCNIVVSDSIYEPAPIFTFATSTNETCSASNGQASVGAVGGTLPYTYLWDDPAAQTNPIAVGLSAGTYVVLITDSNGCTAMDSVSLTNTDVSLDSVTGVNPNCGACDGTATAVASGGATPYTYLWNDPAAQTNATASNLCQGTYTVIMTDGNGCTRTDSTTISEPPSFTVSSTTVDLICGGVCDGSATVTPSGGTAPFVYQWDDPAAQTTATATGLCAGTFNGTVTDSAGCSIVETVTITGPNPLNTITSSTNASVGNSDGTASVTVLGGSNPMTYLWDDAAAQTTSTATGLPAGTYTVNITDGAGCTTSATVTVSEGTGIWDNELGLRFDVYPNPSTGMVIVDLELLEVGAITLEVVDMLGETVFETAHTSVQLYKKETDLSSLSDGIYFMRLGTEKGSIKRRIVVAK